MPAIQAHTFVEADLMVMISIIPPIHIEPSQCEVKSLAALLCAAAGDSAAVCCAVAEPHACDPSLG